MISSKTSSSCQIASSQNRKYKKILFMKKFLLFASLLLLVGLSKAQTTTYTGTSKGIELNPVTGGQVQFTLTSLKDSTLTETGCVIGNRCTSALIPVSL